MNIYILFLKKYINSSTAINIFVHLGLSLDANSSVRRIPELELLGQRAYFKIWKLLVKLSSIKG